MAVTVRIEVKASAKEGLGIFVRQDIRAGDAVLDVGYEREITDDQPLDEQSGERAEHCAYPDGKIMLVAYPARYMNHSCDPNAYYTRVSGITRVVARRRIRAGEELSVDYLINNAGGDSWRCHCGAARCRGETGKRFFDLDSEIQKEYFPLLAPWFIRKFSSRLRWLEG